ncbi:hypothetical protein D5F01_LYC23842 [Larimichthys crocea]|uniref:Uncharacterized protein n=1 Tax=Larimichthys crocea TaxID=215358 RepID=A0A6G0HGG7_LARCR|nr:hypothetical protein D5F01_LYC23842 [Larimichthys crocea]
MATNTQNLPPYVRVATVYGVVALRRTTSGLWAGRGLRKLDCAKRGFLSDEKEIIEWKEVKNTCVVCSKPSTLSVQWEGPGSEKPLKPDGSKREFKSMHYKPVKVMDAYVCGLCRIVQLPRLIIMTQWDLRGTKLEPSECSCQWDGTHILHCNGCSIQLRTGRLLQVSRAKGWQVRRYLDALKGFESPPGERGWSALPAAAAALQRSGNAEPRRYEDTSPSAPALYPDIRADEMDGYSTIAEGCGRRRSLLEEAIHHGWPYIPQYGQMACPPFSTNQVPLVMRVFRDPAQPGYTTGLETLTDDDRQQAREKGWEGPWELTTWGKLIEEVVQSPNIPTEELPEVPREEGARGTNLYYFVTGLDAWGNSGAKAKAKRAQYYVTPEAWHRDGLLQMPGRVASRAATPIRPDQTTKVEITCQMIAVPYRGIYSVGADVTVIEDVKPEEPKQAPEKKSIKRLGSWFWHSFPGRGKSQRKPQPGE